MSSPAPLLASASASASASAPAAQGAAQSLPSLLTSLSLTLLLLLSALSFLSAVRARFLRASLRRALHSSLHHATGTVTSQGDVQDPLFPQVCSQAHLLERTVEVYQSRTLSGRELRSAGGAAAFAAVTPAPNNTHLCHAWSASPLGAGWSRACLLLRSPPSSPTLGCAVVAVRGLRLGGLLLPSRTLGALPRPKGRRPPPIPAGAARDAELREYSELALWAAHVLVTVVVGYLKLSVVVGAAIVAAFLLVAVFILS
ncbi:hypothetical protein TeGR_g1724 [Tetraparma gracilis]|uniref:Uncharacterized protein n=1 Tax=Tetraparma gracilis TaxID=2962635 RepID=A0ABQ6N633_9STRA|nr:hypothetical protein TeGR_g1724 [Tetraparma gracilis]